MKITINATELVQILQVTPSNQNILLIGSHGIGKSEILKRYFTEKGMKVVPFFLGQMSDPGDLIGLMHKDESTGISVFLPPYWWPIDGKPIVLFLDELNRARPEILQSVMDLTLNKTLAGKTLPKGSILISAINDGDEYQITDLDPALVSRFNCYHFKPTVNEWLLWATKEKFDGRVLSFIRHNPNYLDIIASYNATYENSLTKNTDRRAWHRVSDLLQTNQEVDEIVIKAIAGIIGLNASVAFKESLNTLKITARDLLFDYEKIKSNLKNLDLVQFSKLNTEICCFLEAETNIWEQTTIVVANFENYLKWLQKNKQNEVIAHFISEIENTNYNEINRLIFVESPFSSLFITTFISNIK
ncbi:MAG TPA: hypothetical protein DCM02_13625 [Flavobacterium sp.]|nr:hypothetical protein [Flavobacterium sp.]HAT81318.1 hypothetical protein [Flavobacterium sp.]